MAETVGEFIASHAALLPAERIALTIAQAQIQRGDNPEINVTTALLLTIERLSADLAAAEARGRKQAADEIAEWLDETYAMTVYGDIARAYAAEQDTSGGGDV